MPPRCEPTIVRILRDIDLEKVSFRASSGWSGLAPGGSRL